MTVIIGDNYNLISNFLSLVILACLYWYAFGKIYKEGYRDGNKSHNGNEARND